MSKKYSIKKRVWLVVFEVCAGFFITILIIYIISFSFLRLNIVTSHNIGEEYHFEDKKTIKQLTNYAESLGLDYVILDNKVNKVITELNVENLSDREKIEKVHDYILSNTVYDSESDNLDTTSAYGSLILGHAVCSGYSDAMALFLDKFNIPNLKISSANHVWNLVYLDNNWLHLDLTWDDIENNRYRDNYFLITKEKLLSLDTKEHNFDNSFFVEGS